MLREQAKKVSVLPRIADLACVAAAFMGALVICGLREGMGPIAWLAKRSSLSHSGALVTDEYLLFLVVSVVAWEVAGQWSGVYRPHRTERIWAAFRSELKITVVWAMLLASFLYLFKLTSITRPFFLTFFPLAILLLSARLIGVLTLLHYVRARGYNLRRVVVLGEPERAAHFSRFIEEEAGTGLRVVEQRSIVRTGDDMFEVADADFVDEVDEVFLILSGSGGTQELERAVLKLVKLGKRVHIIPGIFDATLFRQSLSDFAGIPVLSVGGYGLDEVQSAAKRTIDVVGSLTALMVLSPIMVLAAIAVKLSSHGRVLFRQERLGQNGKQFWIHKFRTMFEDAEARLKRDPVLNAKYLANNYKLPKG